MRFRTASCTLARPFACMLCFRGPTLEMGTAFYEKGLSLNIAGDESLRFEDNVFTGDRSLHFTVDHHASILNGTGNKRLG
jgi:hypothetical protein